MKATLVLLLLNLVAYTCIAQLPQEKKDFLLKYTDISLSQFANFDSLFNIAYLHNVYSFKILAPKEANRFLKIIPAVFNEQQVCNAGYKVKLPGGNYLLLTFIQNTREDQNTDYDTTYTRLDIFDLAKDNSVNHLDVFGFSSLAAGYNFESTATVYNDGLMISKTEEIITGKDSTAMQSSIVNLFKGAQLREAIKIQLDPAAIIFLAKSTTPQRLKYTDGTDGPILVVTQ